jgi:hypothetical protein
MVESADVCQPLKILKVEQNGVKCSEVEFHHINYVEVWCRQGVFKGSSHAADSS